MNTARIRDTNESHRFLELVDFKWLMAGVGWWVNLSRLQTDKNYVEECLQRAMTSDSELLQERSIEMLGLRRRADSQCNKGGSSRSLGSAW